MRKSMRLASIGGVCGVLLCVLMWLPSVPAQPHLGSYRESVRRILSAHNLEVRDVVVVDSCAPTVERCNTYTGKVLIDMGAQLSGRIDCRARWTNCTLTLPTAGIREEPLPDVVDPLAWHWEQLVARVREWLRGLGRVRTAP